MGCGGIQLAITARHVTVQKNAARSKATWQSIQGLLDHSQRRTRTHCYSSGTALAQEAIWPYAKRTRCYCISNAPEVPSRHPTSADSVKSNKAPKATTRLLATGHISWNSQHGVLQTLDGSYAEPSAGRDASQQQMVPALRSLHTEAYPGGSRKE